MHDQRFHSWGQDLDGGLAVLYSFLDGELCHSAEQLFQLLLGGYEVPQRVEDYSFITFVVGKASVWLEYMWMSADNDVYALLHKVGCPLFFVFVWHGFIFGSPVGYKDDAVGLLFCFLDHGCDLVLADHVDHVVFSFNSAYVCAVGVIQKCDLDAVHFADLYGVGIFLGVVDPQKCDIRIFGFPEVQCVCEEAFTKVIDVVVGGFYYVESCFYDGVSYFCGCCKGWVGAYAVMVGCEDGFLIDHLDVCVLDGVLDMGVDLVVIPVAVRGCACVYEALVVEVVTDCDDGGSGGFGSGVDCFLISFGFGCRGFFLGVYGRFANEAVVQLIEEEDQDRKDDDGCKEACAGVAAFAEVQGDVVLGVAPDGAFGFVEGIRGGFSFEDSFDGVGDFDVGWKFHLWFTLSFFGF